MKFNKKAQLQMGETILVVIFIILLIVLAFVFMVDKEERSINEEQSEFFELDAVTMGKLVTNIPEIIYYPSGVKQESCFDIAKLTAFEKMLNENPEISREYYFEKLGNVNITITQIYPKLTEEEIQNNQGKWEIYINNFDVGETAISLGNPMMIPVSLYEPVYDRYYFGVMEITLYKKK
ncbi:MAG: hypothetical protein AB7V77_03170 [Candidatus Woesearchaeota archaeon]